MSFGVLDSKENKFIKKVGEATVMVNNQSVPFPKGSNFPFRLKLKEITDLVARNAEPPSKLGGVWKRKRIGDIAEAVAKFKEALNKKDTKILSKPMKDATIVKIKGWTANNQYGMQWTMN